MSSIEDKIAEILNESETLNTEVKFDLPEEILSMSQEDLQSFMQTEEFDALDEETKNEVIAFAEANVSEDETSVDESWNKPTKEELAAQKAAERAVTKKYGKANYISHTHSKGKWMVHHVGGTDDDTLDSIRDMTSSHEYDPKTGKLGRKLGEETEMHIDVSQDVEALVNGEELTEEFKTKAATIFEAAVVTRVKAEVAKIEEQFDTRLSEEIESIKEGLIDKVDGYLNYVVEQWMTDNELALENGVKLEIMESFISGMKNVFEEHYIDVPEEKYDALGDLQEQLEQMSSKLDEMLEVNVGLTQHIDEMNRVSAISEATTGMADTDVAKFGELAEELSYDDEESFKTKLQTIKENYFGKKAPSKLQSPVSDSPVQLTEDAPAVTGPMAQYLRALNGSK